MYERIRTLYLNGRLTDTNLANAVTKGWISQEQSDGLKAEKAGSAGSTT